jgi:hypothetical protein
LDAAVRFFSSDISSGHVVGHRNRHREPLLLAAASSASIAVTSFFALRHDLGPDLGKHRAQHVVVQHVLWR